MNGLGYRIGSCFAGIGGLELGLEWAGVGRTVYQIETDPLCQATLERAWPGVVRWGDIATADPATLPQCDVLCGGFPCQDLSVAGVGGARAGLQGSRSGLWSHMARIAEAQRPDWVVVENVARGWKRWLPHVRSDLRRLGYASIPVPLEARYVGANHVRQRLFVLAHAHSFRLREQQQRLPRRRPGDLRNGGQAEPVVQGALFGGRAEPSLSVVADGLPRGARGAYWRAVGNAVVPQVAQVIGSMIVELVEAGA